MIKVEMHFLPPVYVTCDVCKGRRYNRETLDMLYTRERTYPDVLDMTIDEAYGFFENIPSLRRRLQLLQGCRSRVSQTRTASSDPVWR
ncbi:MAG: hypothetical protein Q9N34_03725 [Aquificota bacterium]|nr:hypothetical protein [Aquificota bacterium]